MACNSKNLTKKKIMILTSAAVAIAAVLYYSFTINSVITLAVLPFVLPFLACIIMGGVMGGAMFLAGRLSKKSDEMKKSVTKSESDTDNKKAVTL